MESKETIIEIAIKEMPKYYDVSRIKISMLCTGCYIDFAVHGTLCGACYQREYRLKNSITKEKDELCSECHANPRLPNRKKCQQCRSKERVWQKAKIRERV